MKKKLTLAVLLLAVIGGGAVYFTQYYPEYREIKQLERLVSAQEYYGDQQARKALEDFLQHVCSVGRKRQCCDAISVGALLFYQRSKI